MGALDLRNAGRPPSLLSGASPSCSSAEGAGPELLPKQCKGGPDGGAPGRAGERGPDLCPTRTSMANSMIAKTEALKERWTALTVQKLEPSQRGGKLPSTLNCIWKTKFNSDLTLNSDFQKKKYN